MSLRLVDIPEHDSSPPHAAPSTALGELAGTGARRTVLRAVLLSALTLGATALDWAGAWGARRARAEIGRFGLLGWDRTDCRDGYPNGYAETPDTSGAYAHTYAACFGGSWRSSSYCEAGWHKHGTWQYGDVRADHVPISTACGETVTRNAWKWTTPDGVVYRCSDGYTTFWGGGHFGQTYLTICRSVVG